MRHRDRDLSEFLIFSSHNSYCKHYQVDSPWSHTDNIGIEPIMHILNTYKGGCIELDVVDVTGSRDNDLAVHHGGFPGAGHMSPLRLSKIFKEIVKWSQENRPHWPIILNLDLKKKTPLHFTILDRLCKRSFASPSVLYPPRNARYKPYIDKVTLGAAMSRILLRINTDMTEAPLSFLKGRVAFPKSPLFPSRSHIANPPSHATRYQRVYPCSAYILSHNFDPIPFWEKGVQMVALNIQRNDAHTYVYHRVFQKRPFVHKSHWPRLRAKVAAFLNEYNRQRLSSSFPSFVAFHTNKPPK